MKDLPGRVAVVTGAGSGIGRELALACAREGMKLVLADLHEHTLAETAALAGPGVDTLVQRCDVAKPGDLDRLADATYAKFGAAHVLFNNAGIAMLGPAWAATLDEWKWALDVNVMGVVHGIRSFVPRMLEQAEGGHVVNTASVAGLVTVPSHAVYCASKHAVVAISECMHHDLAWEKAKVGVSVLCPAFVKTNIIDPSRSRPAEIKQFNKHPRTLEMLAQEKHAVEAGKLTAADVARITIEAVKENRFYILPHPRIAGSIELRMREILDGKSPTNVLAPSP